MLRKLVLLFCASVALLPACGSDGTVEADGQAVEVAGDSDGSNGAAGGSSSGGDSNGGDSNGGESNNDDAPQIVGNEDLDLDELAEVAPDAADALDGIDDVVSIGECQSDAVGLAMSVVPDGWQCRVLDAPVGGLDGFTLFQAGNPGGLEITIGTPSPFGPPCEMLQACDSAQSIDLGSTFDMQVFEMAGVPLIFGTHKSVEAEAAVTTISALTEEQIEFVTTVLNGVVEL
jgi:hypothetical protein